METETLKHKTQSNPIVSTVASTVAQVAILLASTVAFGFLPAVKTPVMRIGFGFIPTMFSGLILPWYWCAFIAGMGDLIKYFMFNASQGPLNPGITLAAVLSGAIWSWAFSAARKEGWELNRAFTFKLVAASAAVFLICNLGINTFALSLQLGKSWIALLFPWRLTSEVIMFALHIPVGLAMAALVSKFHKRNS